MRCEIIDFERADWKHLDSFADRTVFQTREWVHFVAETQNATPVLAQLSANGKLVGYFTGLTFTRFGIKVLGGSFPGWTTPYMGFNLTPGTSRAEALIALEKVVWNDLKCLHMEVSDPHFSVEDGNALGFQTSYYISYRTDLTKSEDELFQGMESACRRCVRKAEKSGDSGRGMRKASALQPGFFLGSIKSQSSGETPASAPAKAFGRMS